MPLSYDQWTSTVMIPRTAAALEALRDGISGSNVSITVPDTNDYTVVLSVRKGPRTIVATLVFNSDITRPGQYFFTLDVTVNGVPVDIGYIPHSWVQGDVENGMTLLETHLVELEQSAATFVSRILVA